MSAKFCRVVVCIDVETESIADAYQRVLTYMAAAPAGMSWESTEFHDADDHVLTEDEIADLWHEIHDGESDDDDDSDEDSIGVRGDRREDLEAMLGRDVTEPELDAFIDDGAIPRD